MVSLIMVLLLMVILVSVFLIFAGVSDNNKRGGEDMIKNVYTYVVLFATLMMIIGGSVGAFMATADIIAPAPYHQSFEEFKRWGNEKPFTGEEKKPEITPSEEELKESYNAMVNEQRIRDNERAKNTLIKSFGWILIPLPIFIYFQRRLLKSDKVA